MAIYWRSIFRPGRPPPARRPPASLPRSGARRPRCSPRAPSSTWKAGSRSENCALREIAGQSPRPGRVPMARIAIFLACFLLSASPAWAQAKSSIEKLNAEWMAAFNKGDAKALAAMYTPDAYVLPAGAEMAKGHNAIEKFWGGAVKQLGDAKLTTVDVQSLGPGAAREIGTLNFKTKAQPPEQITGKYVVVWRKMGGQWQLATDIWNMNIAVRRDN